MKNPEPSKLTPEFKLVTLLENKFKQGEIVFDRVRPSQKLVVERYSDRMYYCRLKEAPKRKAVVYLERDLMTDEQSSQNLKKRFG